MKLTDKQKASKLFYSDGKPKMRYAKCLSKLYMESIGLPGVTRCVGVSCPCYAVGCAKRMLDKYNKEKGDAIQS